MTRLESEKRMESDLNSMSSGYINHVTGVVYADWNCFCRGKLIIISFFPNTEILKDESIMKMAQEQAPEFQNENWA